MKKGFNIAWTYFFIHLLVEIVCFQVLFAYFKDVALSGLFSLVYDFLAFVPQSLFGVLLDKHPKLNLGLTGGILMLMSTVIMLIDLPSFAVIGLILVAIGNAMIHVVGAVATTKVSEGMLSHSAIFVGGGSFGVIIGQTLGNMKYSILISTVLCIITIILIQLSNDAWSEKEEIPEFQLIKKHINPWIVILIAFFVVTVRSWIGYAIPISWKKELWQSFLLFFTMGAGKVLGGILSDKFGAKRVGILSTLLCIPFLLFGNNYMVISIIGVFMFSLTMSITFGILLSAIPNSPGLAFGVTTIGLFIGILPAFFIPLTPIINNILIVLLSILSSIGLSKTLK